MTDSWRYRDDQPGDLQYITIKGVGGLPIFALREDVRFLLALLAREVRAGELVIYCYAFVRNHAHFLVRSPHGTIHKPMKRVLERFAIHYNRTRGRIGHVFKDRFHSACIRSEASYLCVVAYTDLNPVRAGLTELPTEYEFGSACAFLRDKAPLWLDRKPTSIYVPGADPATGQASEESYLRTFGRVDFELVKEMIERRRHVERNQDDPLDWFLSPARTRRVAWILEQAEHADGSAGARLLAKASDLLDVIRQRSGRSEWKCVDPVRSPVPWRTLLVGLLRLASARNCRQAAALLGISPSTVVRETRRHIERLAWDRAYLEVAHGVLTEAVRRSFSFLPPFPGVGPDGKRWDPPGAGEGRSVSAVPE